MNKKMVATELLRLAGEVVLPPSSFAGKMGKPSVFLAGAIDMGGAEDWQAKVSEALKDVDCTILNPRRKDWDSSWRQSMGNPQFREQVEWELEGLDEVDVVAVGLPAGSKAPISLMELGLHVKEGNVLVWCPAGYWRKGNVDVVCARYGVPVFEDFGEFAAEVADRLRTARLASRVAKSQAELIREIRKSMPPPTSRHERKDRPSRQEEKRRLRDEY